ncbi:unnamed protein product, partial [Effrenium voratum]
ELRQHQLLKSLDAELEKVKNLSPSPAPPTIHKSPALLSPVTTAHAAWGDGKQVSLPGAPDDDHEHEENQQDTVADEADVLETFDTIPSVQQMRRKKMPWIHKQASRMLEEETDDNPRAFSQLNQEYATNRLRKTALDDFGPAVVDVYKRDSRWTRIVKHPYFERVGLTMIFLNALWIAIDIDFNNALIIVDADFGFILMEILFGLYFITELSTRYFAYLSTRLALKDAWFAFDLMLVFIMVTETWLMPLIDIVIEGIAGSGTGFGRSASVLRVLKVLRVLRTARIIRVARYMPELMILIKGLLVAARSVFFTLVLLLLVTYIFSITFTQLSQGTLLADLHFPTVPISVLTLIIQCVMPDQEGFFREIAAESWVMGSMVLVFIMVGSLIIMNMLVGVLVEAVQTVATCEHEQIHIDFAKRVLWDMIDKSGADENGDNLISEQEFERLMEMPEALIALNRLGVELYAALEYGKLLFEDGQPLTFAELLEGILMLRGSNQTTVKDIVTLRKFTADEFSHLHTVLEQMCSFMAGNKTPSSPLVRTPSKLGTGAAVRGFDEV